MTKAPETIWTVEPDGIFCMIHPGEYYSGTVTEYTRTDLFTAMQAERDAAIARAEKAEAECRESVMQSLASMGQAQDAYEAQVKAEAALARHLKYRDPFETP